MGILMDWIIFVIVVTLTIYLINPLLTILLWVVGRRLRLAHEENDKLSLSTEMISWDGQYAVFRCSAETEKGCFVGYGTSNAQRDSRLAESLIELVETRSVARALRFAGYGVEYTGIEEVLHVQHNEAYNARGNGNGKTEASQFETSNGTATQAQIRALHALARKAKYHDEDVGSLIAPFQVSRFEDLPKDAASKLISFMQQEVAL